MPSLHQPSRRPAALFTQGYSTHDFTQADQFSFSVFRIILILSCSWIVGLEGLSSTPPASRPFIFIQSSPPPLTLRSLLFLFLFLDVCVSLDSTFVHRSNTHTHRNRLVSTHCRPCTTTTTSSSSSSCMRKEQKKRRRGEKKRKTVIGRVCQDGGLGNRAIG